MHTSSRSDFGNRPARYAFYVVSALVGVAAVWALWMLIALVHFEMLPVHHGGDGTIYVALGRAILNGFLPYKDLFEFKPPGMFLISAASLRMFGDIRLGNFLQGVCELGMVILLTITAFFSKQECKSRWLVIVGTLVIGILFAHYLADRSGHFQSESFGDFFALGYFFLLAVTTKRGWKFLLLSALLIAAAVGIKETFAGLIVAGMLILVSRKNVLREAALPLLFAVITGIIGLWLLGYLVPYLTIYLPEMMHGRASFNGYPPWSLPFLGNILIQDVWDFSHPLAIVVLVLGYGSFLSAAEVRSTKAAFICAVIFLSFGFIYWHGSDPLLATLTQHPSNDPLASTITLTILFLACVGGTLFYCLPPDEAIRTFFAFVRHALAFLIIVALIVQGGGLRQQMALSVALFAAMLINVLRPSPSEKFPWVNGSLITAIVLSCIGIFVLPRQDYAQMAAAQMANEKQAIASAAQIDGLMDACGYSRYLIFGQADVPYAYTKHSPYGPTFSRPSFIFPVAWRKPPIPYIQNTWRENMRSAPFAITATSINSTDVPSEVMDEFTRTMKTTPPPCATSYQVPSGLSFYFRASSSSSVHGK